MAKMTAAERYRTRKARSALAVRRRTIQSANAGALHARLRAKHGPDWQRVVNDAWHRNLMEWMGVVEDYNPAGGGVDASQEHPR